MLFGKLASWLLYSLVKSSWIKLSRGILTHKFSNTTPGDLVNYHLHFSNNALFWVSSIILVILNAFLGLEVDECERMSYSQVIDTLAYDFQKCIYLPSGYSYIPKVLCNVMSVSCNVCSQWLSYYTK